VIGVVLALAVVAIVISLFGKWPVGVAIAAVALALFVFFVLRRGRRTAKAQP
jgi:hypothetical protein